MIEAPFRFLEVVVKVFPSNPAQFCQTQLGETPEGLDAINVAAPPGKFVGVMMNTVVLVTLQKQSVVGPPSVGVDRAPFANDLPPDDAHEFSLRAVQDGSAEHFSPPLQKTDHRDFPSGPTPPQASNASRSKVAFIHFHTAGEGSGLRFRQLHNPGSQQTKEPMRRVLVHPNQFARRECSHIRAEHLQDLPKFGLRNTGMEKIFVSHCLSIDYAALRHFI